MADNGAAALRRALGGERALQHADCAAGAEPGGEIAGRLPIDFLA